MTIGEILVKLSKNEQKNYMLAYLLMLNDEDRKDFIENIVDNDLILLAKEQCKRAELVEMLRKKGVENSIVNSFVYPNYLSVLKNYKDLADELLLFNPIELSILFSYLLWNGHFSKDKHNIYKNENSLLLSHMYPYTIMDGWGVCLNHSIMLTDYLNLCGIDATPLKNGIKHCKVDFTYIPPIERNMPRTKEKFTLTSLFANKQASPGNHVFTLIKENEYFYIYDATNLAMFAVQSPTKAMCTVANIKATLYPILSYEMIDNNAACKTLNNFITASGFSECPYQVDYFKFITEKSLETIKQNLNLIDDCYDESRDDIAVIAKHVRERKKSKIRSI